VGELADVGEMKPNPFLLENHLTVPVTLDMLQKTTNATNDLVSLLFVVKSSKRRLRQKETRSSAQTPRQALSGFLAGKNNAMSTIFLPVVASIPFAAINNVVHA